MKRVLLLLCAILMPETSQAAEDAELVRQLFYASVGTGEHQLTGAVTIFGSEDAPTPPCSPAEGHLVGGYKRDGAPTWVHRVPSPGHEALRDCIDTLLDGSSMPLSGSGGLVNVENYATLCRDGSWMTLQVARGPEHWYLKQMSPTYSGSCSFPVSNTFEDYAIALPRLMPPEGVLSDSGTSGYSGDDYHSSQGIFSTGSPDDLMKHYASQLEKDDWDPRERLLAEASWLLVFERTVDGADWVLQLYGVRAADRYLLNLNVNRDGER